MGVYDDQKSDVDKDFNDLIGHEYKPGEADQIGARVQDEHNQDVDKELQDMAAGEQGGGSQSGGSSAAADKEELAKQESAGTPPESDNARWQRIAENGTPEEREQAIDEVKKKRGWRGLSRRAKAGILSGVMGLGVGGGMFGFTIISGPLEIYHFGEILHNTHLSQQEDAGDMRMGRLLRYLRTGNVGETRLSWLGSKYHGKIIAELAKEGIKPIDPTGRANTGYEIDTESEESPYKGMSPEEAMAKANEKIGAGDLFSVQDGKVVASSDNLLTQNRSVTKAVVKSLGKSKIATVARIRNLYKFEGVDWHPMSIADRLANKYTGLLVDYFKEKWNKMVNEGIDPSSVDTTGAKESNPKDPNNPTPADGAGETGPTNSQKVSKMLQDIADSKGAKWTGGLAAVVGIICIMNSIRENIGVIRYAQLILPMERLGMDLITNHDQMKKGQDVDLQEMGYIASFLSDDGKDSSGKVVRTPSTADDSAPLRQNTGRTGGVDFDNQTKSSFNQGAPGWLAWTDNGVVSTLCSSAVQTVTTAISIFIGVFSGSIASTVIGMVASAIAVPKLIDFVGHLVAGKAIDFASGAFKGAMWMNYADYGTAFGANSVALQLGGTQLNHAQQTALLDSTQQIQADERAHETFFARAFDPYDPQSITGKVIDQNRGSFSANMAAMTTGFMHIASSIMSMPATLISGRAHAAAGSYQYPFPIYGFSLEDQEDPTVADPYQNAETVAQILDGPNGQAYIDQALKCFGVTIAKVPSDDDPTKMIWDVYRSADVGSKVYGSTGDYDNAACASGSAIAAAPGRQNQTFAALDDKGNVKDTIQMRTVAATQDANWKRLRFFVLDTGMIEGYTCARFDDKTSCANDAGNGGAAAPAAPANGGNIGTGLPTGNTQQLAQQILNSPNITFQTSSERNAMQYISETGRAIDCGAPVVSSKLLGVLLTLSQNYKLVIGVVDDGHGCDGGFHPKGMAVDLNGVNPLPGSSSSNLAGTGNQIRYSAPELPILRQFYGDAGKVLAGNGGGGLGQQQCFGSPPPKVSGVIYFDDTCNHLHLDVGVR